MEREISEKNGFFYIRDKKTKTLQKTESLKKVGNDDVIPGQLEGTQRTVIVEGKDSYELIQEVEVKANPQWFLDIASQVRAAKDQLNDIEQKLQTALNQKKDVEEDWNKFEPFVKIAATKKKIENFEKERKPKS